MDLNELQVCAELVWRERDRDDSQTEMDVVVCVMEMGSFKFYMLGFLY